MTEGRHDYLWDIWEKWMKIQKNLKWFQYWVLCNEMKKTELVQFLPDYYDEDDSAYLKNSIDSYSCGCY